MSLPWLSDPRRPLTSPREIPKLEAWFDALDTRTMLAGDGSTITDGGSVALWADKSGNSGVNCLVLPGAASNSAQIPDAANLSGFTVGITITVRVRLPDYTPAANMTFLAKDDTTTREYAFRILTTGELGAYANSSGTFAEKTSTGAALSDNVIYWLKASKNLTSGEWSFFKAADTGNNVRPTSGWTAIGTAADTTGTLSSGASPLYVGTINATSNPLAGNVFYASVNNGVDNAGTDIAIIDFSQSAKKLANGDTFVCATGQTVTLNSSGATGARIAGERDYFQGTLASRGTYNAAGRYIATDGTDDYYKTPLYNLPQPVTLYAVLEQSSWTSGDYLFDGSASDTLALIQTTSTPQINLSAGSSVAANTDLATATKALVTIVSNGASSLVSINRLAATTGNAGAGVPNGLTLASKGTAGSYGNARFYEIAVYRAAHDQATRHRFARYVGKKWGFAV